MSQADVIKIAALIARKSVEQINVSNTLGSLGISNSFGLSALRSRLESQASCKLPIFDSQWTIQMLVDSVSEKNPVIQPSQVSFVNPAGAETSNIRNLEQMGLGMDIQEIDELPHTSDFRSDNFYKSHFSPSELATAALKTDPRIHLCGVFCAKEAVKKSHPELLNLRMETIVVSSDEAGKPSISLSEDVPNRHKYNFLISITHSGNYAAATCITRWTE